MFILLLTLDRNVFSGRMLTLRFLSQISGEKWRDKVVNANFGIRECGKKNGALVGLESIVARFRHLHVVDRAFLQ